MLLNSSFSYCHGFTRTLLAELLERGGKGSRDIDLGVPFKQDQRLSGAMLQGVGLNSCPGVGLGNCFAGPCSASRLCQVSRRGP